MSKLLRRRRVRCILIGKRSRILRLAGDEVAVAFRLAGDEIAVAFRLAGDEVAVAFRLAGDEIARALRPGIRRSARGLGESGCCGQKTGGEKRKFLSRLSPASSPWPE
jgi:hypothetical protein